MASNREKLGNRSALLPSKSDCDHKGNFMCTKDIKFGAGPTAVTAIPATVTAIPVAKDVSAAETKKDEDGSPIKKKKMGVSNREKLGNRSALLPAKSDCDHKGNFMCTKDVKFGAGPTTVTAIPAKKDDTPTKGN